MKSFNRLAGNIRAVARTVAVLILGVTILGTSIMPVLAYDERDRREGEEHHERRERNEHRRHHERREYREYYPGAVYEPPPVVVAPPPPPPGISFVFPIHIH